MARRRAGIVAAVVVAVAFAGFADATARASSAGREPHRWAVVVGVSEHSGTTRRPVGAAGDAEDMTRALVEAGWPADHVVVLTGHHANAANIRNALTWLAARSSDDSFSVFHYSGHVKQLSGDPDRDGEDLDEFLWPSDNQFISDAELAARLGAVRGKLWTDIAGCESAGFNEGGLAGPSRLFTSSSAETEKSYELPDHQRSVFGKLMISDAILAKRGDANGDGYVSLREAYVYAADNAPRMTRTQRYGPQHPHLYGGEGGEQWFLQAPPPPPEPEPEPASEPAPARLLPVCLFVCV